MCKISLLQGIKRSIVPRRHLITAGDLWWVSGGTLVNRKLHGKTALLGRCFGQYPPWNESSEFTPENGWLEDDPFLLGRLIFRSYDSFREGICYFFNQFFLDCRKMVWLERKLKQALFSQPCDGQFKSKTLQKAQKKGHLNLDISKNWQGSFNYLFFLGGDQTWCTYMGVSWNGGTPKTPQNDHF